MRKVILLTAMPKESVWSSSIYVNGGGLLSSKISFSRILLLFVCCIFCNNVFAQDVNAWRLVQDFGSLTSSDVKACKFDGTDSPSSIATASIINIEGNYGKVAEFQMLQGYQGHHGLVFSVNLGTNSLSNYTKVKFDIHYGLDGDCTYKDVIVAVRNGSSGTFTQLASKGNSMGSIPTTWVTDFTIDNISSSGKDYSDFELFVSIGNNTNPLQFQIDNIQLYGPAIGSSAVDISETVDNSITSQSGVTVNLTRSLTANVWNTICLPFVPTPTQANTIFGTGAKFAEFSSVSNGVMQFTSVDVASLQAGTPYLVLPTPDKTASSPIVLTGVNITATSPRTVTHDGYSFIGIYRPTSFEEGIWPTTRFVGTGNNLLKPYNTNALKALRAYFTVPGASSAKNYTFAVDSFVPTSIDNIQIEGDGDGAIYNIGGQRVEGKSLPKGIYIREGKKFVVK